MCCELEDICDWWIQFCHNIPVCRKFSSALNKLKTVYSKQIQEFGKRKLKYLFWLCKYTKIRPHMTFNPEGKEVNKK